MGVVEGVWERVGEVGADENVLGIAAVDGVAGEDGVVAEVLFGAAAEGADAVGSADPGDADAHAVGTVGGCAVDDFADDLVAGDEGLLDEGKIAFEDVEVGAADSAGEDAEEEVAWGEDGRGDVFEAEGLVWGSQNGGVHWVPSGIEFDQGSPSLITPAGHSGLYSSLWTLLVTLVRC